MSGNVNLLGVFLRHSRRNMLLAVAFGVISGGATTLLIALINASVRTEQRLPAMAWGFVGLCILRLAAGIGCHALLIRLSQAALFDLRVALSRSILAASLRQLELTGNHRLMAAFTEDMASIANVVVNLPYMFVNVIILSGCLIYVGWLSWLMLGGILVCLLLGALSYLLPVLWANRRLRLARALQDHLFAHFRGLTDGIKQLKLHAQHRRTFLKQVLIPAADHVRRHNVAGITIYSMAANWSRMLFFVYVGLLLWLAPALLPQHAMQLAAYVIVLLYMMAPLEAIMNALPHLAQANVALKHIGALELSLQSSAQTIEHTGAWILAGLPEIHLRLDGIGYAYHDRSDARQFTLGPIDMTLRSGEILFITGGNGSGKTTLVKLISGLYAPQHGHISLNGRRINSHNLENYRQLFSAVFNDSYLFDSLPVPDGSNLDEQARFYLKLLELDQKLKIENGKFSTTALSQGQRKRLTLLTALLEDRPIYVFDEWAADQDPRFKHLFYDLILPRLKARNKAVLVITHDDRYFDWADRILKLEEGKPAETVELIVSAETASPSGIRSCA